MFLLYSVFVRFCVPPLAEFDFLNKSFIQKNLWKYKNELVFSPNTCPWYTAEGCQWKLYLLCKNRGQPRRDNSAASWRFLNLSSMAPFRLHFRHPFISPCSPESNVWMTAFISTSPLCCAVLWGTKTWVCEWLSSTPAQMNLFGSNKDAF